MAVTRCPSASPPRQRFEFVESVWGYRSVEKTPLDLLRWDNSRDIGLLAQGALGGRTRYSVQVGNGSGVNGETDRAKAFRAALRHEFIKGLTVEGYADLQDHAGADRWSTWQVFGAFVRPAGRLGAQVAEQHRRSASGGDATLNLVSVFGARKLRDRLFVYGRADHNFDPVPDGETIDYLPMSDQVGNTLWIGGVDIELDRHVFLQPHVEIVDYPNAEDGSGGSDRCHGEGHRLRHLVACGPRVLALVAYLTIATLRVARHEGAVLRQRKQLFGADREPAHRKMRLRLSTCRSRGGPGSPGTSNDERNGVGRCTERLPADRRGRLAPTHFRAARAACSTRLSLCVNTSLAVRIRSSAAALPPP